MIFNLDAVLLFVAVWLNYSTLCDPEWKLLKQNNKWLENYSYRTNKDLHTHVLSVTSLIKAKSTSSAKYLNNDLGPNYMKPFSEIVK